MRSRRLRASMMNSISGGSAAIAPTMVASRSSWLVTSSTVAVSSWPRNMVRTRYPNACARGGLALGMRIIAGEFRRRLLRTPEGYDKTRPLPDRVKESLFGLLRGHCEGARVLDCFAGSGAFGLEMISRGAAQVVMVERDRAVARILQANIDTLGVRAARSCFRAMRSGRRRSRVARNRRPSFSLTRPTR